MAATELKVGFLLDAISNPNAGTESQFIKLYQGLAEQGAKLSLTVLRDSPFLQNSAFFSNYQCLNITRLASVIALFKLFIFAWQVKKQRIKLVHIFFNDASVIAPLILKIFGIKVIISRRDMGFWYTPFKRAVLRLNGKLIDKAVTNSAAVKQVTHELEGINNNKIEVIYNGYRRADAHGAVEMPQGQILGIVANIRAIKRMQDAVAALAQLLPEYPDLQLVIIGDGDASELEKQAEQLAVREHLHCLGSKAEPANYIQQFDIGLLCSESEGFSNAIIEYLYAGKPVVCSEVGGNPEIITSGKNGYLYPAGDVERLSHFIRQLLVAPERYRVMSEHALSSVASRFDEDKMVNSYASLYRVLIG